MRRKLGLATEQEGDTELVRGLLQGMQQARADFTLTFRQLADAIAPGGTLPAMDADPAAAQAWLERWRARLAVEPMDPAARRTALRRANPAYIPRNHRVESALDAATRRADLAPFHELLALAQAPFDDHPGFESFMQPARDDERVLQTFCGT
jgi:uncharacterized protein YdiU (UPF0061 family)